MNLNRNLMLIAAEQFHSDTPDISGNFEILQKFVVDGSFDTEQNLHLCADGSFSYYNEAHFGKKLDTYLQESRRSGIREIIYWNIHSVGQHYIDENPDWPQVDRSGKPLRAYETEYYNCLNSSWKTKFFEDFRKLCRHDIDGVFLDGPVIPQGACYCPACQADYRRRYGSDLFWAGHRQLTEFHVAVITDLLRETREIMREENPDLFLYINNSALRADVTGSRTRALSDSVDLLGAEGGFVWVGRGTSLWPVSPMAKLIETQAEGRPTVIFIAGDCKPWSYYMHTAPETGMYYAQSVANGASVWYGIHGPISQMDTPGGREALRWNRFLHANHVLYDDTHPVARVGLLWSQDSANYYASRVERTDFTRAEDIAEADSRPRGNHYDAFMGVYEILTRTHIQFNVLDEEAVERGGLDGLDTVILPTVGCMRESVADKLRAFTAAGGTLISTYDTGAYDKFGAFLPASRLADVEGLGEIRDYASYTLSGTGYRRVAAPSPLTDGLSWKLTPSSDLALVAAPAADDCVLAETCVPMAGRYTPLPEEWYPTIWEHPFGAGKCIYFAGTIGETYRRTANPDLRELLERAVVLSTAPVTESDAPGSVEIVLRRRGDGYVLHLINETGEMERPVRRLLPLTDIRITLHTGAPLKAAEAFGPEGEPASVQLEPTEDGAVLTVPKLNSYQAIALR